MKLMRKQRLSNKTLALLCRQLSFALSGGMTVMHGLALMMREQKGKKQLFLQQYAEAIQQGQSLSQALLSTDFIVKPLFLEFVLLGESQGDLSEAMEQAAEYFEQQHRLQNMLVTALLYPALLLIFMQVALVFMMVFVVPAILQTYENFNAPLPFMTSLLVTASVLLQQYGLYAGLALLFLGIGGWHWYQRVKALPYISRCKKALLLKVPFYQKIIKDYYFVQFSQALGLLLKNGVLLMPGLHSMTIIFQNTLFMDEVQKLYQDTERGISFYQSLPQCMFIPPMAQQMLAVGEKSSQLGEMLLRLNRYYQEQLQQFLLRLVKLMEPVLIIVLGGFVLWMAGSLFLPIIGSYQYLL